MGGTEGYILIGIGDRYLQMTENLTKTLKKHGDNRGTLTITRSDNRELYSECNTEFERNGTLPKDHPRQIPTIRSQHILRC